MQQQQQQQQQHAACTAKLLGDAMAILNFGTDPADQHRRTGSTIGQHHFALTLLYWQDPLTHESVHGGQSAL
jgi:hypothetical protein